MGPIESLLIIFGFLILSIIAHEFGHLLVLSDKTKSLKPIRYKLERNKFKTSISLGEEEHYKNLTKKEEADIYFAGIGLGFIPIIALLLSYNLNLYIGILIIVGYIIGCLHDIKQIWRIKNEKNISSSSITYDEHDDSFS